MVIWNEKNRRCVGHFAEYPGAYAWPTYEYRCPECHQWHNGSDTTHIHDDGSESMLCETCAAKIEFPPLSEIGPCECDACKEK
jgi:predicted SprT family Zn-dependent metalloprotease